MLKITKELAEETYRDLNYRLPDDGIELCDRLARKGQELTVAQGSNLLRLMEKIAANSLTVEEDKALAEYARKNGRGWKDALRSSWMQVQDKSVLQQLRNARYFGPQGLNDYKLSKD